MIYSVYIFLDINFFLLKSFLSSVQICTNQHKQPWLQVGSWIQKCAVIGQQMTGLSVDPVRVLNSVDPVRPQRWFLWTCCCNFTQSLSLIYPAASVTSPMNPPNLKPLIKAFKMFVMCSGCLRWADGEPVSGEWRHHPGLPVQALQEKIQNLEEVQTQLSTEVTLKLK